jgi:hypothetical protein
MNKKKKKNFKSPFQLLLQARVHGMHYCSESAVCMHAHVATTHLALEKLVSDKDTELVVFS